MKLRKTGITVKAVLFSALVWFSLSAFTTEPDYTWTSPSLNSAGSMPCGGGDIGLNVWVENGDLLFYVSKNGAFDENNALLKQGRFRLRFTPNPFVNATDFRQTLKLNDGNLVVKAGVSTVTIWVDVYKPVIHLAIDNKKALDCELRYENWRYTDRVLRKGEGQQNSYKWSVPKDKVTTKDSIRVSDKGLCFWHRNPQQTIFDFAVSHQGLDSVKQQMYNPLAGLISGGKLFVPGMKFSGIEKGIYAGTDFCAWVFKSSKPVKSSELKLVLEVGQYPDLSGWERTLDKTNASIQQQNDRRNTKAWWHNFWQRSFIHADKEASELTRNITLFRYMLACNAKGEWPTRFNGGLFTFDPVFTDTTAKFTPDYRKWGGGTFTAQNQRLVYWPLLKSGDADLMIPQFEFYQRILRNAELRSKVYWGHSGACFAEQLESFGLPNTTEYGLKRPEHFDKGVEYNAWLEYEWDTVLEFCQMILDAKSYANMDIIRYQPFIESCVRFFDVHYQYMAQSRGRKALTGDGKLILFPGSACETYKMAYNPSSTIAALRRLAISLRNDSLLRKLPEIPLRTVEGHTLISPAVTWERVNNTESPQLYPVFPWRLYGVGEDSLQIARNTYWYDKDVQKFRSHTGWKQHNIFAACLGLTEEAKSLNTLKLKNGPYRFPAFWGPGYDWSPDHNWGGSGMIGIQEMLLQTTNDGHILLFPAWPPEWNVHFKLHAPQNTTVEAELRNGQVQLIQVVPESRRKDIKVLLPIK